MRTKYLVCSDRSFFELFEANSLDKNNKSEIIPIDPEQGDLLQMILQTKPDILFVEAQSPAYIFQNLFDDLQRLGIRIYYILFTRHSDDTIYYVMSETSINSRLADDKTFFEDSLQKRYKCVHLNVLDNNWRAYFGLEDGYYVRNEHITEILRGISLREFKLYREQYNLNLNNSGYYLFVLNLAPFEYVDYDINKEIYYFIGHSFISELKGALAQYNGGEVLYYSHNLIYVIINDLGQNSLAAKRKQLNELIKKLCAICGCKTSCMYLSDYIGNIKDMRIAHEQYLRSKNNAFFCKDVRLLTNEYVCKTKIDVDYSTIHDLLAQIKDAIQYQSDIEGTSALIARLFLGYIKRSYNFSLYFYCYSSITSMIDNALGLTAPRVAVQEQTLSRFASVEGECDKLVNMLETLDRHRFSANTNTFIFDTITIVKQHYTEDLLISDIARQLHVSATYLSQVFKRKVGKSIIQYLIEFRINQAKVLLASTDQRISDITVKVGFRDACHFSKTFRKITGTTPKKFRNDQLKVSVHKQSSCGMADF